MSNPFSAQLAKVAKLSFDGTVHRIVPAAAYLRWKDQMSDAEAARRLALSVAEFKALSDPKPDPFLTFGNAGRCNPSGVHCIYTSESEFAAVAEYRRTNAPRHDNPSVHYQVDFKGELVDLSDASVLKSFGLKRADLTSPWMGAATPTPLQLLGAAVASQSRVAGLRLPSDAAREARLPPTQNNIVLFKPAFPPARAVTKWKDIDHRW